MPLNPRRGNWEELLYPKFNIKIEFHYKLFPNSSKDFGNNCFWKLLFVVMFYRHLLNRITQSTRERRNESLIVVTKAGFKKNSLKRLLVKTKNQKPKTRFYATTTNS